MRDLRDLRDPQKIGEDLIWRRGKTKTPKALHTLADYTNRYSKIPDYPRDELLSTITAREYREELEERAANGDRYAVSMLAGEPGDEPIDS